jgi:hypothetical protein
MMRRTLTTPRLQFCAPSRIPQLPIRKAALPCGHLQHGTARLLDLKKQWIVIVGKEQAHEATSPDAADPDNLHNTVFESIAVDQRLVVELQ